MLHEMQFTNELDFLNRIVGERNMQYRQAEWLKVPFEAVIWICNFGKGLSLEIDFRVHLDDGRLLTADKHSDLLDIFKCWLCVQSHFDATGGKVLHPRTIYAKVSYTLYLIDYFLLNAEKLKLAEFGLGAITENDLSGLFLTLSASSSVTNTIYDWPGRLSEFLRKKIGELPQKIEKSTLDQYEFLACDVPTCNELMLYLSTEEIIQARAWLWKNNFYKVSNGQDYRFSPNTKMLANILYRDTLKGRTNKPVPVELLLDSMESHVREYPSSPVHGNETDKLSEKVFLQYKNSIRSLGLLCDAKMQIPSSLLQVLDALAVHQSLDLKKDGRYKTLPQQVVFKVLRDAIEFALEYGDDLVDSYLSLVQKAASVGLTCWTYSLNYPISDLVKPKVRSLGVEVWTLEGGRINNKRQVRLNRQQYFDAFRLNPGLRELIRVLYGATQIVVGALMARRIAELYGLKAGHCLDQTGTRLVFYNGKSGIAEMLEKESRPIPKIGAQLIRLLERLQTGLINLGLLKQETGLFCFPSWSTNTLSFASQSGCSESIDYFCDYFQTPVNQLGQRYYIRQHQLRRFFAMLFFWGHSFGGMDTLRWFLGHTDLKHLYNYITESTPGEVLRSVKAHFAGEQLVTGSEDVEELSELIEHHFGTRKFSVLDSDELDEYIEDLMIDGYVEIEPEFIETPEGQRFRILVKIKRSDVHDG